MDTFEGILFGNAWQTSVTGVLSFSLYARTHEMYDETDVHKDEFL